MDQRLTGGAHSLISTLERRILHGLASEWRTAVDLVGSPELASMRLPLFALADMSGTWGYWCAEKREICLSRSLVFECPWDSVREVLLHEMAHQFATEILCARGEPPHGESFQKACRILRANPRASGTHKLLHERIADESSQDRSTMMDRVRKLLALAASHNPHEAEAAMKKAHELIGKYNVEIATQPDPHLASCFVGRPALRHPREKYWLAHLLQDFYFVRGIWVPTFVLERGKMGRVLEISGRVHNVSVAVYVHGFVERYIDDRWREYNKRKGLHRRRKTDFAMGIVQGLRSKLQPAAAAKEGTGLNHPYPVPIRDSALSKYIAYKYPYVRNVQSDGIDHDPGVMREGLRLGKTLVIRQAISERKTGGRPLIEHVTDGDT